MSGGIAPKNVKAFRDTRKVNYKSELIKALLNLFDDIFFSFFCAVNIIEERKFCWISLASLTAFRHYRSKEDGKPRQIANCWRAFEWGGKKWGSFRERTEKINLQTLNLRARNSLLLNCVVDCLARLDWEQKIHYACA